MIQITFKCGRCDNRVARHQIPMMNDELELPEGWAVHFTSDGLEWLLCDNCGDEFEKWWDIFKWKKEGDDE